METQSQIEKQPVDNQQDIKPNNNWNKQFNKLYHYTLLISFVIILIFTLVSVKNIPAPAGYFAQNNYRNYSEIMEIITQSIGMMILIPAIFLISAIILKLSKKLNNFNFVPLVLTIIIGYFIWTAWSWLFASEIDKPVIYLYPQEEQETTVQLDYQGKITADYPKYDESIKGWNVTAYPDGHIVNHADNQEYSYLFWEGESNKLINWDLSTGFVVKGKDTREFLQQALSKMGLTPKEFNEFIVYWYPKMKDGNYNLIHFADKQYTETAPLTITPRPDSMLRVFMVYKPLNKKVNIEPQTIQPFVREGFTVVEWGGTEIK